MYKSIILAVTLSITGTAAALAKPLTDHIGGLMIKPMNNDDLSYAEFYIQIDPRTLKPLKETNCRLYEDLHPNFKSAIVNKSFTWGCVPVGGRIEVLD